MATRTKFEIKQGASFTFRLTWPTIDLRDYNIYFQVRPEYASSPAKAALDPLISVSMIGGTSDPANAITYVSGEGGYDTATITLSADQTVLLVNQDDAQKVASHKADVFLVKISDPTRNRVRPADFDVYAIPRTTVVE